MWCWIKSSFVDLDGWENGWFWFGWSEFLRGDYLIAKAKVLNICAVTEEKLKDNAAKIPNVCQNFDVCCMNLEQFMQKEGWSF